jgi:uncharacterized membrane protein
MNKETHHGMQRYIIGLKKIENIGKLSLSIGLSAIIALLAYAVYSNQDKKFVNFGSDPLASIANIVFLSLFLIIFLAGILYLILSLISNPKKHEMLMAVKDLNISKNGNSYSCGADSLYIPSPWAGLLPTNKSVRCKIGIWSSFSLVFNGIYLLEIEDEGFIMSEHEQYGFFKYKAPGYIIIGFFLSLVALFILFMISDGFKRTDLAYGMNGIFVGMAILSGIVLSLIIKFIRNFNIKSCIKKNIQDFHSN